MVRLATNIVATLSLVAVTLLSGCGFHLRGMADAPRWLNNVAIVDMEKNRDLEVAINDQLQAYHIFVNPEPTLAHYWLVIESSAFEQNVTNISSSTTPRQYQLIYTVHFKLQTAKGQDILSSRIVSVTRQATSNSNRILGSNEEQALIMREMKIDAAVQIINRIGHAPLPAQPAQSPHAH